MSAPAAQMITCVVRTAAPAASAVDRVSSATQSRYGPVTGTAAAAQVPSSTTWVVSAPL